MARTLTTIDYFAYGSNLLTTRLRARCPTAAPGPVAEAVGYRLVFAKRSDVDGSGKATLLATGNSADRVPGVVFRLQREDLGLLDRIEGAGSGYDRHDAFAVRCPGNRAELRVHTYLATRNEDGLLPFDWYLALVIAGTRQHGFATERFAGQAFTIDERSARPTRQEALDALAAVGIRDYRRVLP